MTAIRMLEAVLENDDEVQSPQRKRASSLRETREKKEEDGTVNGINIDDRQAVMKGISLISSHILPFSFHFFPPVSSISNTSQWSK